jgi:hypothetical protein
VGGGVVTAPRAAHRLERPAGAHDALAPPDELFVVALRNPVLEGLGHHPASRYAERYWLPTLGPTACWLHRNLVARLEENPHGVRVHLPTVATEIGVGTGMGRNSPVIRTLTRLCDFQIIESVDGRLGIQMMLPPLSRRQAARLPEHLATELRSAADPVTSAVRRGTIGVACDRVARNGIEVDR